MTKTEVKCPVCGNKLMLAYNNTRGSVEHKCKKCKHIILIDFTSHIVMDINCSFNSSSSNKSK